MFFSVSKSFADNNIMQALSDILAIFQNSQNIYLIKPIIQNLKNALDVQLAYVGPYLGFEDTLQKDYVEQG